VNYFRREKNKRKELIKEEFVGISRCQLHITASIHCGGELCSEAVHLLAPSRHIRVSHTL